MADRSSRTRTRTARGRSWRWRCAPPSTSPARAARERCELRIWNVEFGMRMGNEHPMRISRRRALALLTAGPVAAMTWTNAEAEQAHEHATQARAQAQPSAAYKRKFFTAHEYATVGLLVDLIIPRDERSGSATEAGVPEFMDFMMVDQPRRQVAMRGGLALLDRLAGERFGRSFLNGTAAQRRQLLDEIAYTSNPDPGLSHAIAFFS